MAEEPSRKNSEEAAKMVEQVLEAIAASNDKYSITAYRFVFCAVPEIAKEILEQCKGKRESRHISGQELTLGLRQRLIATFGMMSGEVLRTWGITSTMDFGNIVYDLVDAHLLSVSPQDSRSDFIDVFDFYESFYNPKLGATATPWPQIYPRSAAKSKKA